MSYSTYQAVGGDTQLRCFPFWNPSEAVQMAAVITMAMHPALSAILEAVRQDAERRVW